MKLKRFLAVFLVAVMAYFGSNAILNKLEANQAYGDDFSFDDDAVNKNAHEHLILLVGVDKNFSDEENEDFTRTDTIMLLKANTETGKIELLSIPRDSRVKIRDEFDKVNHAHAFGGIQLSMQTLRNFLGLDIDYYIQVNYKAVENIIDALGGVDFNVPKGVNIDLGKIKIKEGPNHFDGEHALWYLRTRKIYLTGDLGRVNAQQGFMKAMVDEIVKKSEKINLMTFITNYFKYVKTNVPMGVLVDLTNNIKKFSSDKVTTLTVPGNEQTIDGISYYLPDVEKTWELVDTHFKNFKLKNWTREKSGFEQDQQPVEANPAPVENPQPAPSQEAPSYNYQEEPSYEYEYEYEQPTPQQPAHAEEAPSEEEKPKPKTKEESEAPAEEEPVEDEESTSNED